MKHIADAAVIIVVIISINLWSGYKQHLAHQETMAKLEATKCGPAK